MIRLDTEKAKSLLGTYSLDTEKARAMLKPPQITQEQVDEFLEPTEPTPEPAITSKPLSYRPEQPYEPVEPPRMDEPGIEYPFAKTLFVRPYAAAAEAAVPGARRTLLELAETHRQETPGEFAAYAEKIENLPWYKKMPELAGWAAEKTLEYKALKGLFAVTGLSALTAKVGTKLAATVAGKELAAMGGKAALTKAGGLNAFARRWLAGVAKAAPSNIPFLSAWSASEAARRREPVLPAAGRGAIWGLGLTAVGSALTEGTRTALDSPTVEKALVKLQTKFPRVADFLAGKPEQEFVDAAIAQLQEEGKIPRGIKFTDLSKDLRSFMTAAGRKIRKLAVEAQQRQVATEQYWAAPGPKAKGIVKPTPPPTVRVGEVPPKPPIVTPPAKAEPPTEVVKRHAVDILPRKQEILGQITESIKGAPSEAALRRKLEKEIPEPSKTFGDEEYWKLKQEKAEKIAAEIDKLKSEKVHFEINGGADIIKTKEALQRFKEGVTKLPEKDYWPLKEGPKKPAKKPPIAAKRESVGELYKTAEGWFTDGYLIVKGKPPAKAKYRPESPEAKGLTKEVLNDILFLATEPATLEHYAIESPETGKGISQQPIAGIGEAAERGALAVFKVGDKYYSYAQGKFNVIRNRYPDADYGISAERGALIAYAGGQGNNPVALLMPIQIGEEEIFTTEPPVTMEVEKPEVKAPAKPAEEGPLIDTLLDERQRLLDEAWDYRENYNDKILRQNYEPKIREIDRDLAHRGVDVGRLPSFDRYFEANRMQAELKERVAEKRPAKEAPPAAKEPWEMTREEYRGIFADVKQGAIQKEAKDNLINKIRSLTNELEVAKRENKPRVIARTERSLTAAESQLSEILAGRVPERIKEDAAARAFLELAIQHKKLIQSAAKEGKPIPPHVLAEYPDLKPAKPKPARIKPFKATVYRGVSEKTPVATGLAEGTHFTTDKKLAQSFAEDYGKKGELIEKEIILKKPFYLTDESEFGTEANRIMAEEEARGTVYSEQDRGIRFAAIMRQTLESQGYDGIVYNKGKEVIVFKKPAKPKEGVALDVEEGRGLLPEPKSIGAVVVDQFRDFPEGVTKPGSDFWTEIMAVAKEILTPLRYKALRKTLLGVFRHAKGAVAIEAQDVRDTLTTTHELGHNIDYLLNDKAFPKSIKLRFPDTTISEPKLRAELKAVSQIMRPDLWEAAKTMKGRRGYVNRHTELMADYIGLYILDPEKTRGLAPNITQAFEKKLASKPELFDAIDRLHAARYESVEPPVTEHLRKDWHLPREFKPLQLHIDMQAQGYVRAAEELGIDAARHYKLLMHRAGTQAKRIDELVPSKARQTDLVVLAENGSKNPWTGKTKEQILKETPLTAKERKALSLYRANQELARQTVNKYLRGADIPEYINFIEDYFIHAYETPLTQKYKSAISRWAKKSPQAKKRVLPDLDAAVELGLTPRAKTLSDGLRLWAGMNYRVSTNIAFLRTLPKITNDDGISVLQKPSELPGWPTVDYWPIRQTYKIPLEGRGILLFQGRVAVDPRVKPFIDAMFGRRVFSSPVRIIEGLNAVWKGFQLTLFSLFHHQAEFFSAIGGLGPRALPGVGGFYGKKAQAFGAKKPVGFLPARVGVLRAGKELEKSSEFMEDYLAHGGQTGYISTEGINLIERSLKRAADYLERLIDKPTGPLTGVYAAAYVPVKTASGIYSFHQKLLWDNVLRAKLVTYYNIVADGCKHSDLPVKDVKQTAAKYVADNFGGQEWLNSVFKNPKTRQFWTQVMMSLDWTWSQIKTGTWPFRFGGKTAQEKARRALMRKIGRRHWFWYLSAIAGFTIGGNYALNRNGPWENETGHRLDVDWTNLWRGLPWNKDWEARGDYSRRYIGLGKAGRELARWVTSPLKAFGYKLSPVARSIFEQSTGYNVGSDFSEPWAREDMELYQEIYARSKHLMLNFEPFAFSGNNAFLAFPSRKGMTNWKAVRAYEKLYAAKARVAMGGAAAALTKANRLLSQNDDKLLKEIAEACKANGVDSEKMRRAAVSNIRSKYYRLFWKATTLPEKRAAQECHRYAQALIELGARPRGFRQSYRYRRQDLPPASKEIGRKAFMEAKNE